MFARATTSARSSPAISATFGRRETVAVLGPNGSGKTTLFRTAMRLMKPSSGQILVEGRPIAERTVAPAGDDLRLCLPEPEPDAVLQDGPRGAPVRPAKPRPAAEALDGLVDDVLRRTALDTLEDIRERPPLTLSFGQQKRLALAIALALSRPG